jgi:hypothetical protein
MILNVLAGLLVVLVVPLIWKRVGGGPGFLAGVFLIPLIWGAIVLGGMPVARSIWGADVDLTGIGSSANWTPVIVFALIAAGALFVGRVAVRGRK